MIEISPKKGNHFFFRFENWQKMKSVNCFVLCPFGGFSRINHGEFTIYFHLCACSSVVRYVTEYVCVCASLCHMWFCLTSIRQSMAEWKGLSISFIYFDLNFKHFSYGLLFCMDLFEFFFFSLVFYVAEKCLHCIYNNQHFKLLALVALF